MKIVIMIFLTCLMSNVSAEDYESYKLKWAAPNAYTNSETLSPKNDLSSYKIYYGPSRERVRENSIIINPSLTRFTLSGLDKTVIKKSSIIYLAMTAVSNSGSESDLSEIIFFLP